MGDDADEFAALPQFSQRLEGGVQGFLVKCAKPFIEEETIDPDIVTGHGGQAKRQGQADEKTFPAGKIAG